MKILILTCRFGNGHYSAAKSIQQKLIDKYEGAYAEAVDLQDFYQISPRRIAKDFMRELQNLKEKFGDFEQGIPELPERAWSSEIEEVKIVDVFELAYPEIIDYIYKMYNQVVDKGAKLMNYMYKRSDEESPSENIMFEILYNHVLGAVTKLLFKENPDIIISAFSICSELISIYKKLSSSTIPLITAITDIYPHSTWINEYTDYYLVAVEETKAHLIQSGVEASSIAVVGMPLSPMFERMKKQMADEPEEGILSLHQGAQHRTREASEESPAEGAVNENTEQLQQEEIESAAQSQVPPSDLEKQLVEKTPKQEEDTAEGEVVEKTVRSVIGVGSQAVLKRIKKGFSGMEQTIPLKASGTDKGMLSLTAQKNEMAAVVKKDPYERKLLIMGGGLGMVPADLDFYKRLNKIQHLKTTVVTGKNRNLYIRLKNRFKNVEVLGFVSNVDELMKRSDLLLTKSGGLTTFEAMYAQLPMAIFKPFLAQEVSNAEFVRDNRFGIVLDAKLGNAEKEIGNIVALLFDKERLREMKENMKNIVSRIEEDKMLEIVERLRLELSRQAEDEKRNKLHKISRFE